jgi:ATP-binding cassette subfamily C protein LapB
LHRITERTVPAGQEVEPHVLQQRIAAAAPMLRPQHQGPRAADPLVEAFRHVALSHDVHVEPRSLTSGIPLVEGRLPADRLAEAARRLGLHVETAAVSVRRLQPSHCPAIVLMRDGSVAVLERFGRRGRVHIVAMGAEGEGRREEIAPGALAPRVERILLVRPARDEARDDELALSHLLSARVLAGNARLYAHAIAATVAVNLLGLAIPLFTMNVYDRVLPNNATTTLIALAAGAALAALFDLLLRTLRGYLIDVASRRSDIVTSTDLFGRVLGARLAAQGRPVGISTNTLRETETLREFNTSLTLATLGDLPFGLLFVVIMAVLAGPLALVPVIAFPVVLGVVLLIQLPLGRLARQGFERGAVKNAVLVELLSGLETIKALGAEGWAAGRHEGSAAEQLRLGAGIRLCSALGMNVVSLGQAAATIAIVVMGVPMVAGGDITAGALMASVMLLSRAMQPVSQVVALATRLHQIREAKAALKPLIEAPQERPAGAHLIVKPQIEGAIDFEGVTFGYAPDERPVLKDLSFAVAPGERIGILGAIGSGKSTILKLALKLYEPTGGRILIDRIGLAGLDPAALRMDCGYLGQDAALFRGTIRENITMHRAGASDGAVIEAARAAGALDWIARLGRGFDMMLGEGGQGLSGGQKRSLALARALLGMPRLLLLDEPTSEMDGRSEQLVIDRLKPRVAGRTLLIVTHKHATLELVDRVIVLADGQIAMDGPKEQVLAAGLAGAARRTAATQPAAVRR